jgi:long-chain acyl-CoA synthetase
MATMRSLTSLIELRPDDRFLSFLPLSHITERSVSHFGQIAAGAETWFARSFATVAEDLRACRPTLFFGVPRVWEKFRQGILERVDEQPFVMPAAASHYLTASGRGQDASSGLGARLAVAEHTALDAVVGRKLRRQLGLDRARLLACGAAPVDPELLRWFHGIGLPVAEGYGMTEVSLCTSMNRPGDIRIGTVGPPVPGVSVKISAEGEILVRGENVCAGYWRDPAASSELVDAAGWLHTGDLGQLDADGFLRVTGRKKALIITAYGKNISPETIETRLRGEPLISQAVVIGDDRPYLAALLTIDLEAAAQWAQHRKRALDLEALTEDPAFHKEIAQSIDRVNSEHSHAEGVRAWRVLANDFTLAAGELTPTLKVKRDVVARRYSDVIDDIYGAAT